MHRRSCLTVNTKYMTRVIRRRPFDSEEGGGGAGTYSDPFSHKLNLNFFYRAPLRSTLKSATAIYVNVDVLNELKVTCTCSTYI